MTEDQLLHWGPPPEGVRIGFLQPDIGQRAYAIGKGSDGRTYLVYAQTSTEPMFARITTPTSRPCPARVTPPPVWTVWPPETCP